MTIMKLIRTDQEGFTLIELIVVIAIMGVLAAITAPTIASNLGKSREQSYYVEKERLQSAVDGYIGAADNDRFLGLRTYPLLGNGQTDDAGAGVVILTTSTTPFTDQGDPFNLAEDIDGGGIDTYIWNPVGGTQGVDLSSTWVDGTTAGIRTIDAASEDGWSQVQVTRGGVPYYTDARYFFIDFEALVTAGLLQKIPETATLDSKPSGSVEPDSSYEGSYVWYVDDLGEVKSLYYELPSIGGFVEGVYP